MQRSVYTRLSVTNPQEIESEYLGVIDVVSGNRTVPVHRKTNRPIRAPHVPTPVLEPLTRSTDAVIKRCRQSHRRALQESPIVSGTTGVRTRNAHATNRVERPDGKNKVYWRGADCFCCREGVMIHSHEVGAVPFCQNHRNVIGSVRWLIICHRSGNVRPIVPPLQRSEDRLSHLIAIDLPRGIGEAVAHNWSANVPLVE